MRTSTLALLFTVTLSAQELPMVTAVEHQPLAAQVLRLIEALQILGEPLPKNEVGQLQQLAAATSAKPAAVAQMQKILDRHCLVGVNINPESRVKAQEGPAKPELIEQGWRSFLVKVQNDAGITPVLSVDSPTRAGWRERRRAWWGGGLSISRCTTSSPCASGCPDSSWSTAFCRSTRSRP